jgi:hypothetical protein
MSGSKRDQPARRSVKIICFCGGRIELYADSLGTCDQCKRDFYVDFHKGARRLRELVDHRKDLS